MPRSEPGARSSSALILAAIAVVVGALYFAREFLVPIALSILLAFLLAPLVTRVERIGLGRIPSVIIIVVFSFGVIGVIGWIVTDQLIDLANKLPEYRGNIQSKIDRLRQSTGTFERPVKLLEELSHDLTGTEAASQPASPGTIPPAGAPAAPAAVQAQASKPVTVEVVEPSPSPIQFLRDNVSPVLGPLATAGLVIIFVIFMLIQREDLRDRIIRLISHGQYTVTTQAFNEAADRISRYLLMQLIVNVTYGIPIAIGLFIIGVPNALLWGLLATVLRFIPYIGPWIAATLPILLSLAAFEGFARVILTVGLYIVVEMISNNIVEPWLYGASTGLSASAILVAAAFWTWLWGPIGLLLSTPMTVCLVVIGKYVPQMRFLDVLLGDEPVLSPPARVYQRLLAGDPEEAADLIDTYLEDKPLIEVYDNVLLPAVGMAEQDYHGGQLDEYRHTFILDTVRYLLEELAGRLGLPDTKLETAAASDAIHAANRKNGEPVPGLCLLCLPAHDEADELACIMLTQMLTQAGCTARYLSVEALASEMVDTVVQQRASILCISALPPSASAHARYLCKRLRSRIPDLTLMVGLWTARRNAARTRQRLACGETDKLVTTIGEVLAQVQPLAATLLNVPKAEAAPVPEGTSRQ